MLDTAIYISITRGNETLTLDGNLYLFGELLTTLNDAARQFTQANPCPVAVSSTGDPKKEGSHETD